VCTACLWTRCGRAARSVPHSRRSPYTEQSARIRKAMKTICILLTAGLLSAAEPDWSRVERSSLELLQKYIRIPSMNPPGNTEAAAKLFQSVLEQRGIPSKIYSKKQDGHVNLLARL